MYKDMPSMEYQFEINVVGNETQERYVGEFKYKRPNLGIRRQIKIMEDQLNNGSDTLDDEVRAINMMVSWLHFTLLEHPKWWNGGLDMYDANILEDIYMKILDFERKFKEKIEDFGKEEDEKPSKKQRKK